MSKQIIKSEVIPGNFAIFRYFGTEIPFEIIFETRDHGEGKIKITNIDKDWTLYYDFDNSGTLQVEFDKDFIVENVGKNNIVVGGFGVFRP